LANLVGKNDVFLGEGEAPSSPQELAQKMLRKLQNPNPYHCDPAADPGCAVPACAPDPTNPDKCAWPTQCGIISQGPGQTGGSHALNNLNAIDVNTTPCGGHMDVTSLTNGKVYAIFDSLGEGDHDPINGGYGNRVVIESTDAKGNVFYVIYAHLWYPAQIIRRGKTLQVGDVINTGDPIGKTDNNGLSDIDHLHLEIRGSNYNIGGPNINTILPQTVPTGVLQLCRKLLWHHCGKSITMKKYLLVLFIFIIGSIGVVVFYQTQPPSPSQTKTQKHKRAKTKSSRVFPPPSSAPQQLQPQSSPIKTIEFTGKIITAPKELLLYKASNAPVSKDAARAIAIKFSCPRNQAWHRGEDLFITRGAPQKTPG